MSSPEKYLLWMAQENVDFRIPEIQAIATLFKIHLKWIEGPDECPFWIVEATAEDVEKLASRSVTLRCVIKLWGWGDNIKAMHENLRQYPKEKMKEYLKSELSFRVNVETFNKTFTMKEKVDKIELFHYLPMDGPVSLKNPDVNLYFIEFYGLKPAEVPDEPYSMYFGVWICNGQRNIINKYSLKTRKFIGNTSMDPQFSLLMANQALVKRGDIVMDPFVGSGSLLVAAAHFGAYVMGVDIDFLMLHGKTRPTRIQSRAKPRARDESVYSNMKQYGTENLYLDVLVGDSSLPLWHNKLELDSIITDPPYGIREATEKIGSERDYTISAEHAESHIPSKVDYSLSQLFLDLMKFAVTHLKMRGRLVSWIPIYKMEYKVSNLPHHPCLKLIANSEQSLNAQTSRRLLTWEKISDVRNPSDCGNAKEMFPLGFRQHYFGHSETRKQKHERAAKELADKGLTYVPRSKKKES